MVAKGEGMDRLMTIEEVAAVLRVSRFTVYRLAKGRVIPATKIGHQWRFQKEEITRWLLRAHRTTPHNQP